jgi:hypothetical protein
MTPQDGGSLIPTRSVGRERAPGPRSASSTAAIRCPARPSQSAGWPAGCRHAEVMSPPCISSQHLYSMRQRCLMALRQRGPLPSIRLGRRPGLMRERSWRAGRRGAGSARSQGRSLGVGALDRAVGPVIWAIARDFKLMQGEMLPTWSRESWRTSRTLMRLLADERAADAR